jgi:hypothetical protein
VDQKIIKEGRDYSQAAPILLDLSTKMTPA